MYSDWSAKHGRQAGITLLEMLVVLALLSLSLGLVVARGPSHSPRLELRAAAGRMAETLRLARTQAIVTDHPVAVVVDGAGHRFAMDGGPVVLLPTSIAMAAATVAGALSEARTAFTFESDGSAAGGHVDLASGGRRVQVNIDWLTGRIGVADEK